jgi:hypothetical protein
MTFAITPPGCPRRSKKLYLRWPIDIGLLQKKWIGRRWAAGAMMAVAVATRDYFASYDQPRPLVSLARFPASIP